MELQIILYNRRHKSLNRRQIPILELGIELHDDFHLLDAEKKGGGGGGNMSSLT